MSAQTIFNNEGGNARFGPPALRGQFLCESIKILKMSGKLVSSSTNISFQPKSSE